MPLLQKLNGNSTLQYSVMFPCLRGKIVEHKPTSKKVCWVTKRVMVYTQNLGILSSVFSPM